MNTISRHALALSVAAVLAIVISLPLSAQNADMGNDKKVIEFQELLQNIKEKGQEFTKLREEIGNATGEDQEALGKVAAELAQELVADVEALSGNVVAREKDGQDVGADRETVSEMYERVSEFFRDVISNQNEQLSSLRKERETATPEDLPEISKRLIEVNGRFDNTLKILVEQIGRREAFGLKSATEKTFLEEVLAERAELLTGRIELAREDMSALDRRLEGDPDNAELATEIDVVHGNLDLYVERLGTTAEMMDVLELETADYQQLLFEVTGEITSGLLSRDVLGAILKTWKDNAVGWLTTTAPRIFFKVVLFLLILFVFRILSKIARKIVRKAIKTSSLPVSQLLERTALSLTGGVVMIFGFLIALSQLGFKVGPLLAGLGVVGFIVGFALQDTLSNFAAGFMILLYRPYDVGDLIDTAGAFGKVDNMTLVSTTLLTLDHQTLVIPNSKIWGDVIKNVTAQKIRRIDMVFGISYTDDIPHAEKVLEEILENHEGVLESPEPVVKLHNLGESSVDFVVRPWAKTDDYWDVFWDITREVKMRFDAEGISIPFPQRDVHVITEGPGESA